MNCSIKRTDENDNKRPVFSISTKSGRLSYAITSLLVQGIIHNKIIFLPISQ